MRKNKYDKMQMAVFTVRITPVKRKKDQEKVNSFLKDKEIIKQYTDLVKGESSYWTMTFYYNDDIHEVG